MDGTVVATGMTGLTEVVTWLTGQFGGVIDTIVAEPILLLSVGIFACGSVIGMWQCRYKIGELSEKALKMLTRTEGLTNNQVRGNA
ncbi:MAG: hypothetical protein IJA43_08845 [Clostridia bacterium]|nr:hypothetical protein [Clostridia bacterium]